jgi:hypothetical protein
VVGRLSSSGLTRALMPYRGLVFLASTLGAGLGFGGALGWILFGIGCLCFFGGLALIRVGIGAEDRPQGDSEEYNPYDPDDPYNPNRLVRSDTNRDQETVDEDFGDLLSLDH